MARSTWNIYVEASGGGWDADSTIYRPNDNMMLGVDSTLKVRPLVNGGEVVVTLDTKYTYEQISFVWMELDEATYSSYITKIENYIKNNTYVKITDHNAVDYIGYFINIRRVWYTGKDDTYDLNATFKRLS